MPLTAQEEARFQALSQKFQAPKTGLLPEEEARFQELAAKYERPQEKTAGEAFAEAIPLSQMGQDLATGKPRYTADAQGAGNAFGDAGAAAGVGASMAALGGPATALGIGGSALLNVGLEKSGISPYMRKTAENIREAGPKPQSQSVASNFFQMLPTEIAAQGWELAPSIVNMLAMGIGSKAAPKVAKAIEPSPVPPAAQAIEAQGGQPTPAMRTSSPIVRGVLNTMERSARSNPLTMGKFKDIDAANAEAVGEMAKQGFGNDVMGPVRANAGSNMQGVLMNLADERARAYQPAVEAFSSIKDTKGFGAALAEAIEGVKPRMLPSVRKLFAPFQKTMGKGDMTPDQVELEIQDLRNLFDSEFANLKTANKAGYTGADRSFQMGVDAIKDTYYNELDRLKPGLGKQLREAKGEYAVASEAMSPLTRAVGRRTDAPENIVPDLMASGTEGLAALKASMNPKDWELTRTEVARTLLDMAKGKDGGISVDKLQSLINNNAKIREILPVVFDEGAELGNIRNLIESGKLAGQNELGRVNPSGSGALVANVAHAGAAFNPSTWPYLAAKTGMDAAYTYAGNPILDIVRKGQGMAGKGLNKAGKLSPLLGVVGVTSEPQKRKK